MPRVDYKSMEDEEFQRFAGREAANRSASYEQLRAMVVDFCRRVRQRQEEHDDAE